METITTKEPPERIWLQWYDEHNKEELNKARNRISEIIAWIITKGE